MSSVYPQYYVHKSFENYKKHGITLKSNGESKNNIVDNYVTNKINNQMQGDATKRLKQLEDLESKYQNMIFGGSSVNKQIAYDAMVKFLTEKLNKKFDKTISEIGKEENLAKVEINLRESISEILKGMGQDFQRFKIKKGKDVENEENIKAMQDFLNKIQNGTAKIDDKLLIYNGIPRVQL